MRQFSTWLRSVPLRIADSKTNSRLALTALALAGFVFIGVVDRRLAGQVLYCTVTILAFIFSLLYAGRSNWRETAAGRALLYVVTMFGIFSAWVSMSFWLGQTYTEFKDVVRGILLVGVAVVFVNLNITLFRLQRSRSAQKRQDAKLCPLRGEDSPSDEDVSVD